MSYLGKVFESLTNKIQSVQVFILSYRANPKRQNDGKWTIWLNPKLFYCSVVFETVNCVFFLFDRTSLEWFYIYFPAFPAFSSIRPGLFSLCMFVNLS